MAVVALTVVLLLLPVLCFASYSAGVVAESRRTLDSVFDRYEAEHGEWITTALKLRQMRDELISYRTGTVPPKSASF